LDLYFWIIWILGFIWIHTDFLFQIITVLNHPIYSINLYNLFIIIFIIIILIIIIFILHLLFYITFYFQNFFFFI
jgi:hypothetical protein